MLFNYPPTIILRHKKENLKKCSLRGIEDRPDVRFYCYPSTVLPPVEGYILLDLDALPLSPADGNLGLFLLDATWRYADKMLHFIQPIRDQLIPRSIPSHFVTAYPRRQDDCPDPERGLASIEALFVAYTLLGRDPSGLLDHYHWKEAFLKKNFPTSFLDAQSDQTPRLSDNPEGGMLP